MTLPLDALRCAALKTLADDVGEALTASKTALKDGMAAVGADRVTARLPDGTKVASLPLAGGESRARVTGAAAFLAWVTANRPDMLDTVVRPAYVKAVLDQANTAGAAVDTGSGEVIPGVTFEPTTQYVAVSFAKGTQPGDGGREAIRAAWRTGELDVRDLLAIEGGGGGE